MDYILQFADQRAVLETVGGKGASLARLVRAGLPVPDGFHVTTTAYRQFVAANSLQPQILAALATADAGQPSSLDAASRAIRDQFSRAIMPPDMAAAIEQAYAALNPATSDLAVAVRSSATAEDLPDLSFAGQQDTFLNIRGAEAVLGAVQKCWASLWTARAIGYRLQHKIDQEAVSLAVVVQQLVFADAAGILFTAHPVSGQRDQAMLTATWGLGEAIVGGLVTPDTLVVDKSSGHVVSRETAEKRLMTVRVANGTEEQAVPEARRRVPVLSDQQAAELVRLGVQIEHQYEMPMDIEWTLADSQFAIVQARPITALPEPAAPAPLEWKVPDPKRMCFRSSIVEQLPDPLTPLFATLGGRIIGAGTARLFNSLLGKDTAQEDMLTTINGYAYYQMRFSLSMVWGIFNALRIAWPLMANSRQRWHDAHARYAGVIDAWQSRPMSALTASDLLEATRQLMAETVNTYNILQSGVLGLAGGAEVLFTAVYDRLAKRPGDPPAATFLLGYDSLPIVTEKSLYDLAQQARACPALAEYLLRTPTAQLAAQLASEQTPAGLDAADWQAFQRGFARHLAQYGHVLYDLDFAKPLPADTPAPLLETCKLYLSGRGPNPHERQKGLASCREAATQTLFSRLGGLRLKLCRKTLGWAQSLSPAREDSLADLGLGYPLLRQMLHELGSRLKQAGMFAQPDDVYWLSEDEAAQATAALDQGKALTSLDEEIRLRRAVWRAQKQVTPPTALPERSRISRYMEKIGPAQTTQAAGNRIQGAGASQGCVTGKARVLSGPEDFGQMQPGEILVAAITTPAWTPLFAMASAIVTDVGGPLSHGSIVAREYGIPAVLGTGVATRRIRSGQIITVDGTKGEVRWAPPSAAGLPTASWTLPNPRGRYMRGGLVDFMPHPLSPLFATLGLTAIFAGLRRVMKSLTRSEPVWPADYFTTINGYAYLGFGYTAREWWWIISGMLPAYPRILRVGLHLWRKDVRPRYAEAIGRWQVTPVTELSPADLLRGVNDLMDLAGEYIGALMIGTMGAAAGTEALFTRVYDKLVKKAGDPAAPTFVMGYDSLPIQAEKSGYDLAEWLQSRPELAAYILSTPSGALLAHTRQTPAEPPAGVAAADWDQWQQRLEAHLSRYGHILYDLDFAKPLPADDPTPLVEACKMYLRHEGGNPHERQKGLEARRIEAAQAVQPRLKGLRRWAFNTSLRLAQSLAEVRESAIADMGLGYPVLRAMLLELGRRLAAAGALEEAADIFWLDKARLEASVAALAAQAPLASLAPVVQANRAANEGAQRLTPPTLLPPAKKYLGINLSAFLPADEAAGDSLKGVAASAGRVTAPARVLHGPEDFDQMRPGEVLVAAITTPAWTPLFAMASAVVTDVGGPLSHGSIVAREYSIPAVMGTGVATRRIQSGQAITVDGGTGIVSLGKNGK